MQTIEYRDIVDKSEWGDGPWSDEPDKVQWQDAATGLPCLAVRSHSGNWCGYVGVPPEHPAHGADYNRIDVEVHGGLTFAHGCVDQSREAWEAFRLKRAAALKQVHRFPNGDCARFLAEWEGTFDDYAAWVRRCQATTICHLPGAGEPDGVWWFGFDAGHVDDLAPGRNATLKSIGSMHPWHPDEVYRDLGYMKGECARLAAHLAAIG